MRNAHDGRILDSELISLVINSVKIVMEDPRNRDKTCILIEFSGKYKIQDGDFIEVENLGHVFFTRYSEDRSEPLECNFYPLEEIICKKRVEYGENYSTKIDRTKPVRFESVPKKYRPSSRTK